MRKIQTVRQIKGSILVAWIVIGMILGVATGYVEGTSGGNGFLSTGIILILWNLLALSAVGVPWAFRNQVNRGLRYMWKHYKFVLVLRKQLLDVGIYRPIKIGAAELAVLPDITVKFSADYNGGTVYIKNSIKFHEKLNKTNISAALGNYVVEQVYLTDDANHYYFEFYDSSVLRRFVFNDFETFKAHSRMTDNYKLFIDQLTVLPLAHHLIVGQTGSGKTYALHGLLMQMFLKPIEYHLYFADPKASSIALLGGKISPANTADNYDDIIVLLEKFVSNMGKRQLEMREHLKDKIDGDYRDFHLSPHILIFDEFAAFSLQLQAKDKKQRDYVNDLISQVVLKGRQSGFFIWIVMQQAGSNNIPTFLRDNLPWKTVLGNAEDQTYVTAFGAGVDIPERKMEIGEGVYTYPAIANKPTLCAFPTLNFDILAALDQGAGVL